MSLRICAVTNVYNEKFNLPIWLKHYSQQIGSENLLIVDHGSTDGSTLNIGSAGIVKLPRSAFDDRKRSDCISSIVNGLLSFYDVVFYTDADELLVADPREFKSLRDFFEKRPDLQYVTSIGLNLIHHIGLEDPIALSQPVMSQRKHVQFVSPMCKTNCTRKPIRWGGGFHSSTVAPIFDKIYLFHLRPVDIGFALGRLSITRNIEWSDPGAGLHQRRPMMEMIKQFSAYSEWPIFDNEAFDFSEHLAEVNRRTKMHGDSYFMPLDVTPSRLYRLPAWFGDVF